MYVAMNTHINATIVRHRDPPKYVTFPHSHHNTADSSHSFINAQHLDSGQAASMFLNVSYHSLAQSVSTSTATPAMEESETTTVSDHPQQPPPPPHRRRRQHRKCPLQQQQQQQQRQGRHCFRRTALGPLNCIHGLGHSYYNSNNRWNTSGYSTIE